MIGFADRSDPAENLPAPADRAQDGVLSPDGSEIAFVFDHTSILDATLAVVRRDGSDLRDYPQILRPEGICWSSDKSTIVTSSQVHNSTTRPPQRVLVIFDLSSRAIRKIDLQGNVTPQCWSPGQRKIVYASGSLYDAPIRVFDLAEGKSEEIAHGSAPTWSPDGQWIAFQSGDAFYVIRPSGSERKLLFRVKNPRGCLMWSPDSRIVSYETFARSHQPFDPTLLRRIHVRRLADNSEDWVGLVNVGQPFVWIRPGPEAKP